jgi:hypothetical protein
MAEGREEEVDWIFLNYSNFLSHVDKSFNVSHSGLRTSSKKLSSNFFKFLNQFSKTSSCSSVPKSLP